MVESLVYFTDGIAHDREKAQFQVVKMTFSSTLTEDVEHWEDV